MKKVLKFYNSLSRKKEDFVAVGKKDFVGVYTCGPTVYHYVTIGNWRTYVLGDLVVRSLSYAGYDVEYYMNITDVGHLTGDNEGDADTGEDRLEKGAKREGKTAWEVAEFYSKDFLQGFNKLNLVEPKSFLKATDHIKEQIDLVRKIEEQGFCYVIADGVYFDVAKYESAGNSYGELSTLDHIREGARVEKNAQKRDPRDFALWKFSPNDVVRDMEWESPWGKGFPGWHIECSAMSMKYLGERFDIHVGGEDLRSTHHPNEIAQSEAATGEKPFVKYWLHGAFLQIDGGRMGKSLGNAYTLQDVEARGFSAMDLRYFYLTGYYRKPLNFTWESLEAASRALARLEGVVQGAGAGGEGEILSESAVSWQGKFVESLGNDLDMPGVLAVVWGMVRDTVLGDGEKALLLKDWDRILGLNLGSVTEVVVPKEVVELVKQRDEARADKDWGKADSLRVEIENQGFEVEDLSGGTRAVPKR